MANNIITPVGVLSYPSIFQARAVTPGAAPRYSLNLIFDEAAQKSDAYKALSHAIQEEALRFFNKKIPSGCRMPIRDAAEKDAQGYGPGKTFIGAWSKTKPGIVGPDNQEILIEQDVFAGQLARAVIRPFGYDNSGNKGVGLYLVHVQIAKMDAPRLDGKQSASQAFANAPLEVALDEAPF